LLFAYPIAAIGASTAKTMDDCVSLTQDITDAARTINPDVLVLVHGGPVADPDDVQYIMDRTKNIAGFYGASSLERLPVEIALTESTKRFKNVRIGAQ
jgi:predicted TIM-barrel enzyme